MPDESHLSTTPTGVYFDTASHTRPELLDQQHPGEHVWVATAAFRVPVENLRKATGGYLDQENLAMVGVGCFICEEPYSDRLSHRKCPGEPKYMRVGR